MPPRPEPSGSRCRFRACLRLPFPIQRLRRSASPLVSINLTVRTMLLVAAIVGLAWAFVYIREAILTLFLALFGALVLEPVVRLMQRHTTVRPRRLRDDAGPRPRRALGRLRAAAPVTARRELQGLRRRAARHGRGHHDQLDVRLVARRAQLGARDRPGEREGDRAGHRRRGRRRDRGHRHRLQPRPHPRHRDLPDAVPDDRPAAADRRRRLAARPARLRPLAPDVGADHHRRLADDARQHRDLDHLRARSTGSRRGSSARRSRS